MLSRRAKLNFLAAVLDQIARALVNYLLTPILIGALGDKAFGYWQILLRTQAQLVPLDGRASEALKWQTAISQTKNDNHKRIYLTASLIVWLLFLPLFVLLSSLVFTNLPVLSGMGEETNSDLTRAGIYIFLNMLLLSAITFLEAVLRGMNIGYRRAGLMALSILVGGGFMAFAATNGYGLSGVAAGQLLATVLYFSLFVRVVRKYVPWVGISRAVSPQQVKEMLRRSLWYTLWGMLSIALFYSDVIILGFFSGTEIITFYVVTIFMVNTIAATVTTAVFAAVPGLGRLVSEGNLKKVKEVREEGYYYILWLSLTVSFVALSINKSFVGFWVGADRFAGQIELFLIVICALLQVRIRFDSSLINLTVNISGRCAVATVALLLTLGMAYLLVPLWGIIGLCLSLIVGRFMMLAIFPRIVARQLSVGRIMQRKEKARTIGYQLLFLGVGYWIGDKFTFTGFYEIALAGLITFVLSAIISYFTLLPSLYRRKVFNRIKNSLVVEGSS